VQPFSRCSCVCMCVCVCVCGSTPRVFFLRRAKRVRPERLYARESRKRERHISQVSLAKEPYKRDCILQKRPMMSGCMLESLETYRTTYNLYLSRLSNMSFPRDSVCLYLSLFRNSICKQMTLSACRSISFPLSKLYM